MYSRPLLVKLCIIGLATPGHIPGNLAWAQAMSRLRVHHAEVWSEHETTGKL